MPAVVDDPAVGSAAASNGEHASAREISLAFIPDPFLFILFILFILSISSISLFRVSRLSSAAATRPVGHSSPTAARFQHVSSAAGRRRTPWYTAASRTRC